MLRSQTGQTTQIGMKALGGRNGVFQASESGSAAFLPPFSTQESLFHPYCSLLLATGCHCSLPLQAGEKSLLSGEPTGKAWESFPKESFVTRLHFPQMPQSSSNILKRLRPSSSFVNVFELFQMKEAQWTPIRKGLRGARPHG